MQLAAADIEKVPAENLRVSRAAFAAVWAEAERHQEEQARRHVADWYGAGVVMTCRWLAQATVRPPNRPWYLARAPVTGRLNSAMPELIEAECLQADLLLIRNPAWLASRPGWAEAVVATLDWAWRRSGRPPIDTTQNAAG